MLVEGGWNVPNEWMSMDNARLAHLWRAMRDKGLFALAPPHPLVVNVDITLSEKHWPTVDSWEAWQKSETSQLVAPELSQCAKQAEQWTNIAKAILFRHTWKVSNPTLTTL
jgi:hypothetical protein